ncbi:MAG: hypothetical protein IJ217_05225 [Clostridia bacterium]|nr:hypothetical protein [Clostridia bacterium]
MKKENGVTLASVVITVIVIILISSTSIIVGNRLILEAKEQKQQENYQTVLDAVRREAAKASTGGVISPKTYEYIGTKAPIIGRDSDGNPVDAGEDWYLLDQSALEELGIKKVQNTYLANYSLGVVIDVSATEDIAAEINKYVTEEEATPSL